MLYHYFIDIVDACNLACKYCIRGQRHMLNTKRKMPLAIFRKIIAKIEEHPGVVALFNWTEPFLHDEIDIFVSEICSKRLRSVISTNLSMKNIPTLEATLNAGLNKIIVSVSGFTPATHKINHFASNIDTVKRHLQRMSQEIRNNSLNTIAEVHYLKFKHNLHEIADFKKFAEDIGFTFIVKEGRETAGNYQKAQTVSPDDLLDTSLRISPCGHIFKSMAIDHAGDAYLCCNMPTSPYFRIGSFVNMDFSVMQLARFTHPACSRCGMKRDRWSDENHKIITSAILKQQIEVASDKDTLPER